MWRLRIAKLLTPILLLLLRKGVARFAPEVTERIETSIHASLQRYTSMKTLIITVVFFLIAAFLDIIQGFEEVMTAIWQDVVSDNTVGELAGVLYAGLLLGLLAFYCYRWIISRWRYLLSLALGAVSILVLILAVLTIMADEAGIYGHHPRFWWNTLGPMVFLVVYLLTIRGITKQPAAPAQAAPPTVQPTPPQPPAAPSGNGRPPVAIDHDDEEKIEV